ncbi:class I SAM-dependent methyltransferase [bacterium]|nr:MAG: class I SAM-dependent methyltransferase [bacterium]
MNERFLGDGAQAYRRRARRLIPDYEGLHEAVAARLVGVRSFLSVGCGDGEDLSRVAAERRVGVDPAPDMIRLARERLDASVELVLGEASDLEEAFEGVASILVGHFVPYGEKDGFYRGLRERCEGRLVIAELIAPVDADLWGEKMIANGTEDAKARTAVARAMAELFPLSREELIATVERAGFQMDSEVWSAAPFSAFAFMSL